MRTISLESTREGAEENSTDNEEPPMIHTIIERQGSRPLAREVDTCIERSVAYSLEHQTSSGSWEVLPDARLFDTGFVTYALSSAPRELVGSAVDRAKKWLETARAQSHEPLARILEETPRAIVRGQDPIDLRAPELYGKLFQRKTLLLYGLARHAGMEVLSPLSEDDVRAKVRATFDRRNHIVLKQWSRVDLVSVHVMLEFMAPDPSSSISMTDAVRYLRSLQSDDGSFCHNPMSTAIAFLALSTVAPGSEAWRRSLQLLLDSQQPDGTWRFCTSAVWDTSLTVRSLRAAPLFRRRGLRPAVDFLDQSQNDDGGWGFHADVESDNDTTSCVLLALQDSLDPTHTTIVRAVEYLLRRQRADGLWNTWQSDDDRPVDDCVAHVVRSLTPFETQYDIDLAPARRWLRERYGHGVGWSSGWYRMIPYSLLEVGRALQAKQGIPPEARESIVALQNSDGGWPGISGETSRASATGLALAALMEHGSPQTPIVHAALRYLIETQDSGGTWRGRPEMYGPRPLIYHLQTNTHAFASHGLISVWRRWSLE